MAKISISELENTSRESMLIDVTEYEQYGINGGLSFRERIRRVRRAIQRWAEKRGIF